MADTNESDISQKPTKCFLNECGLQELLNQDWEQGVCFLGSLVQPISTTVRELGKRHVQLKTVTRVFLSTY